MYMLLQFLSFCFFHFAFYNISHTVTYNYDFKMGTLGTVKKSITQPRIYDNLCNSRRNSPSFQNKNPDRNNNRNSHQKHQMPGLSKVKNWGHSTEETSSFLRLDCLFVFVCIDAVGEHHPPCGWRRKMWCNTEEPFCSPRLDVGYLAQDSGSPMPCQDSEKASKIPRMLRESCWFSRVHVSTLAPLLVTH